MYNMHVDAGGQGGGTVPETLVQGTTAGGVATLRLDSPANRNALSRALRAQLAAGLTAAIADPAVRVIVLTHEGPVFCSGKDLREPDRPPGDGEVTLPEILDTIWTAPKPVVARLAGPARAAGVGLAAACDVVVAADDVTFAFSEVRIGVLPAVISAVVRRRMPPYAAHEYLLTGAEFDARRAAQIGLVNLAAPPGDLDAAVGRYCEQFILGGPVAIAETKRMLRADLPDLRRELDEKLVLSRRFFASEEAAEGIRARLERRPPSWAQHRPAENG